MANEIDSGETIPPGNPRRSNVLGQSENEETTNPTDNGSPTPQITNVRKDGHSEILQYEHSRPSHEPDISSYQNEINREIVQSLTRMNDGINKTDHGREMRKRGIIYSAMAEHGTLDIYFYRIKKYQETNNLTSVELMENIHETLKAEALQWYSSTFARNADQSYKAFQLGLLERFEEILNDTQLLLKAAKMKYDGNGGILTHIDKVVTLLSRGSMSQMTQVEVIRNVLPEDIQRAFYLMDVKTVGSAITTIKKLYPNQCQSLQETFQNPSNRFHENISRIISAMRGTPDPTEESYRNITFRQNDNSRFAICELDSGNTDSTMFYSVGRDDRPHITVTIKGYQVTALVDTDSQITVIGSNIMLNVNDWGERIEPYIGSLYTVDRSSIQPIGQIYVDYELGDVFHTVPTIVVSESTDYLILGMDFLSAFDIGVIDMGDNTLLTHDTLL